MKYPSLFVVTLFIKLLLSNISAATLTFLWLLFALHAKSLQSCLTLLTPWTIAHQAAPSMRFFRQEHWDGLPCPAPGDRPHPRI